MDIFVATKAVALTFFSVRGILWFKAKKFNSTPVICTLLVSIAIVISELAYRFTDRNLRYRFFQNAFS